MAKIRGKGSTFSINVAGVLTPVASLIDVTLPTVKAEMAETRTLNQDGPAIGKEPTGYIDCGSASATAFFESDTWSAVKSAWADDPLENGAYSIGVGTGTGSVTISFLGGPPGFGGKIVQNDFVKCDLSVDLAGLPS